eukprot:EG_transcript_11036
MSCDDVQPLSPSSDEAVSGRFVEANNTTLEGGTWATPASSKVKRSEADNGPRSPACNDSTSVLQSSADVVPFLEDDEKLRPDTGDLLLGHRSDGSKARREEVLMTSVESISAAREAAPEVVAGEVAGKPVDKISSPKKPPSTTAIVPEKTESQCCIIS